MPFFWGGVPQNNGTPLFFRHGQPTRPSIWSWAAFQRLWLYMQPGPEPVPDEGKPGVLGFQGSLWLTQANKNMSLQNSG